MRFVRRAIAPVPTATLRALAARAGWLLESPDVVRCGLGGSALAWELPESGAASPPPFPATTLAGDDGPAGSGVVALGSLPFERSRPGTLHVPRILVTQDRHGGAWVTSRGPVPDLAALLAGVDEPSQAPVGVRSVSYAPTPEEYAHRVARAVERLRHGELAKVVLARAVLGTATEEVDPAALAQRLRTREPHCTLYSLPLRSGRRYVGASPELLVRREGETVTCHPLAGTIALPSHVAPDDYEAWLLGSHKNRHEHDILVQDILDTLRGAYDVAADAAPSIVALRSIAHLGTWVTGTHRGPGPAPSALDLLRRLHPTAAVGGIPRESAESLIGALEGRPRGPYAGPVGWIDAEGDGEWWIGIRGVLLRGAAFEAWAGAGIVDESDPIAEREETRDKLLSVLSALLSDQV